MLAPWKKSYDQLSILKSRDLTLLTKVRLVKAMVFPVAMYGCDSWTIKKTERQRIDAFELWFGEDSWKSLGLQGDQTNQSDQPWTFIGRTEAEAVILWPPEAKNRLNGKDPDSGNDWRQEEKGMTEDELVGWHHWLDRHESEQALGVGDGQEILAYCSPWGHKESDTTEQLNWTV